MIAQDKLKQATVCHIEYSRSFPGNNPSTYLELLSRKFFSQREPWRHDNMQGTVTTAAAVVIAGVMIRK